MGGERAGEWARDCHFSFSGLTDPNNRVSTGGESEGREDSEDKNQSLNPPNQQLSGDSTDTLDPSSRLPSFVLMKAMPSLSRQKVLTTNPDDFSPTPHLPLHPFISFHPSLCEKVPAASLKRQMWEHRFLPKAPTALTVLQYFLFICGQHMAACCKSCLTSCTWHDIHGCFWFLFFFNAWVSPFCSSYQTGLALTASSYHRMYKQNKPTINACTVDTNLGDTHTHTYYKSKLVNVTTD